MTMSKQTALMEAIEKFDNLNPYHVFTAQEVVNVLLEFLPKERQDIIDAFNEGYREGEIDGVDNGRKLPLDVSEYNNADNYFTQTYNQK